MPQLITGIQQVGIGVADVDEAWSWYRQTFGMDVPVFDDEADATLMKQFTGNQVHSRRAVLALNMNGGGGFEIWQFKNREPAAAAKKPRFGDLGINAVKIKSANPEATYQQLMTHHSDDDSVSELFDHPKIGLTFWITDPYGNVFQVVKDDSWFKKRQDNSGGVCGVVIGVSDIDKSASLYTDVLGFDTCLYDETGTFDDLPSDNRYRRTCFLKPQKDEGAFSRLLGGIQVELLQDLSNEPRKIYRNRYWGDLGFIHVCFDVNDMDKLKTECEKAELPFIIDSANSFDMGEAAGRFSYIEDHDGTLIEFVQTHKLPVLKKWGWFLNLQNRKRHTPLPNWMLRLMSLNRVS
jgi:catechol 2,3-dioxygenase-like lactoylglutathione lyase family enzyme